MTRFNLIVALAGLALVAAAFVTIEGEAPTDSLRLLTGVTHHDHGEILLADDTIAVTHQFHLLNTSDRAIRIDRVSSTCGCTTAAIPNSLVQPGTTLTVDTQLMLSDSGRRAGRIFLITDQHGPDATIELHVEAAARRLQQLTVSPSVIDVGSGADATVSAFWIDSVSDATPGALRIDVPDHVAARSTPWQLVHARDPSKNRPARWTTSLVFTLKVAATNSQNDQSHEVRVAVSGSNNAMTLRLRTLP